MTDDFTSRDAALRAYLDEVTPTNGFPRLANMTALMDDRTARHVETQIGLAFAEGWRAREALTPPDADEALRRAVEARIKPLVWQHEARNGWKVGVAWTDGHHCIRRDDGWHYGNGSGGIFPTIEAAKAAAQADYTRRILAALGWEDGE